ncbi:MAG: ribosomal protein S18-alanine N-acetyltransferase [Gemmatimonadaceae bacterium]
MAMRHPDAPRTGAARDEEPRIRRVAAADLSAIVAIERASFTDPWSKESFVGLSVDPRVLFVVADRDGEIEGYAIAWFAADEGEIANLAVAERARRGGLGARLIDVALAEARAHGAATVYLEVRDSNAAARRLYASRGFEEFGRRKNYYRLPMEDALVLRRVL